MGWDVLLFRLKDPSTPPLELDETKVLSFGPHEGVREQINAVLPGVDWSDPAWGYVRVDGCSLEFSLGRTERSSIGVHAHGGGDPVTPIVALCRAHGWVAFDGTAGEYLDLASPSDAGWRAFQEFRDTATAAIRKQAEGRD